MAQLKAPSGGTGLQIEKIAPPGQYVAVCLRVNDLFGVERQKFQSTEMETRDVTRFVFGLKGQDGQLYLIQTYEFTISGAPGSNLVKFLKAWLGQDPQMGWDYAEMKGRGAMITVQHKASSSNPGQHYANITGITPVFQQLAHLVPNPAEFEPMLQALEKAAPGGGSAPAAPGAPKPPGATYSQPGAPVAPPVAPPPVAPPPVSAPVLASVVIWNAQANSAQEIPIAQAQQWLAAGHGAVPAMKKGDTAWSTLSAVLTPPAPVAVPGAPTFAPGFTPAPGNFGAPGVLPPPPGAVADDEVPF